MELTKEQLDKAAEVLVGLDHTDDYIRGFGTTLEDLAGWEADAARSDARKILEAVL